MHNKKDFHRLLSAKFSFDDELFWCFHYWYEKEFGKKNEFFCKTVDVIGYPSDGYVTLEFDGDKNNRWDIPLEAMYYKDKEEDMDDAYMLWHSDYYDGPLSGLAVYKGKKVWFQCIEWEDENLFNMRIFNLHELSKEELEEEERWHQFFCDNVGYHCNYDDGARADRGNEYTEESMKHFYDEAKKRPKRDYTNNKVIATLDESFFHRGLPEKKVDNDADT